MKILVLQLARLGDIYLSWPALRALRRTYPDAQIDLLVRERFQVATMGLSGVDVLTFPTQTLLKPLIESENESASLAALQTWMDGLAANQYDQIINFSFSPFSSYLTAALTNSQTQVRGYTRHNDGFFNIVDDTSAYFYAQVGIGKANRYHLTQIFAAVAGVDLAVEDWGFDGDLPAIPPIREPYIVVHPGASLESKTYAPYKWTQTLKRIESEWAGRIFVIGSIEEAEVNRQITEGVGLKRVTNLTGQTRLEDTFAYIKGANLLVGGDSAPIHIASHVGTPVFNLSFHSVNFYETGPTAIGSRVLLAEDSDSLPSDILAQAILHKLRGESPAPEIWTRDSLLGDFKRDKAESHFAWDLIQALYTGAPFPQASNNRVTIGFKRLLELTELALQQMNQLPNTFTSTQQQILEQVDNLFEEIPRMVPECAPVVAWFQTERLRIPPGSTNEVLIASEKVFGQFHTVLSVYAQHSTTEEIRTALLQLCEQLGNSLREWDLQVAAPLFSEFLELCRSMARVSSKVGNSEMSWSSLLQAIETSFEEKNYLRIADLVQHEVSPALQNWSRNDILAE